MNEWYTEIQEDESLMQGQIIFDCPVLEITSTADVNGMETGEGLNIGADLMQKDVIVITQACDLANNNVDHILVVELYDSQSKNKAKDINKGKMPRLHLLNRKVGGAREMEYKIIDFSLVYTLPLSFINAQLTQLGTRLQLQTPYAEYVSQRFGAYYSRIGLPNGISEDEIKEHHS